MALKERLIDRDAFKADHALTHFQILDPIDQEERIPMRQDRLNLDVIQADAVSHVLAHFAALSNSLMTRSVISNDGWLYTTRAPAPLSPFSTTRLSFSLSAMPFTICSRPLLNSSRTSFFLFWTSWFNCATFRWYSIIRLRKPSSFSFFASALSTALCLTRSSSIFLSSSSSKSMIFCRLFTYSWSES